MINHDNIYKKKDRKHSNNILIDKNRDLNLMSFSAKDYMLLLTIITASPVFWKLVNSKVIDSIYITMRHSEIRTIPKEWKVLDLVCLAC